MFKSLLRYVCIFIKLEIGNLVHEIAKLTQHKLTG